MRSSGLLSLPVVLAGVLAAAAGAEEQFYYVDPVHGVDVPGGGTQDSPWRTITYARTQPLHTLARLNLLPGEYSAAGGESFPIVLPGGVNVVGFFECGARIVRPLAAPGVRGAVFRVEPGGGGPGFTSIENLAIETGHRAIDLIVPAGVSHSLDARNLVVGAHKGVVVWVASQARANVYVGGCRMDTDDVAVQTFQAPGTVATGTTLALTVSRSFLSAHPDLAAVEVVAAGPHGNARVDGTSTVLHSAGIGLHLVAMNGASMSTGVENFLFHGLGTAAGTSGGIVDTVIGGGPAPRHEIWNSIFWGNLLQSDLPSYDPARYTLVTNLFEDGSLVGIGGSIGGPPRFVDAAGGDWHVLPASPVPDAGTTPPSFLVIDFDRDPRHVPQGGDGVIDIGPDEFFARYVYFHPRPSVGRSTDLRVIGTPNDLYFVFVGPITYWPPFGSGLQLTSVYFPTPLAAGVVGSNGLAQTSLPIGPDPAQVGFPYMAQAVYVTLPGLALTFSANAYKGWICD